MESINGDVILPSGENVNADVFQKPVSDEFYFIVPNKCTEAKVYEEPQCAAVCPVDCCIPDENNIESEESLGKQQHPND